MLAITCSPDASVEVRASPNFPGKGRTRLLDDTNGIPSAMRLNAELHKGDAARSRAACPASAGKSRQTRDQERLSSCIVTRSSSAFKGATRLSRKLVRTPTVWSVDDDARNCCGRCSSESTYSEVSPLKSRCASWNSGAIVAERTWDSHAVNRANTARHDAIQASCSASGTVCPGPTKSA